MLELGGKSPQIIFEDAADTEGLGAALAQSAFFNTGQLCVARTRLIVHESIKDQIVDNLRREIPKVFTSGNPLDEAVNFGPIASDRQFDRVHDYIELGKQEGAEQQIIETGGNHSANGYFLPPVIFDNAHNHMRIAQEEIFGPVMAVITFKTESEAIQIANDVNYGLAATAWTRDLGRTRRLARDLQAGSVEIRSCTAAGASDTVLSMEPFGGSGHGVLGGPRGLNPYVRLKAVQMISD